MDFFYRTEDIKPDEIEQYFVETAQDRKIINLLKQQNPLVLVGSRGVGKSFLLRIAQSELLREILRARVLPVYVTFNRSSLIQTADPEQFQHWMMARLCHFLLRAIKKTGKMVDAPPSLGLIAGGMLDKQTGSSRIESIMEAFEYSYKQPGKAVDAAGIPTIDGFLETVEDLCEALDLARVSFLIDEAAHVLLPAQQRQFFTLFRDLRSPFVSCNAAVYPGLTSYGDTFQPSHDATVVGLERDVLSPEYVANMREIVEKQAQQDGDATLLRTMAQNAENFAVLAYAASGNPRIMLKTVAKAPKLNSTQVNEVVREYYRTDIWADHSALADAFPGHKAYIDWGRRFIEDSVLPEVKKKNDQNLASDRSTSCYFWIHRDAPQAIKESLRLLAYTGLVSEHATGIRATRAEIGTRYAVNLGCVLALEATPNTTGVGVARNLTPKRMTEFGANHPSYKDLVSANPSFVPAEPAAMLQKQLGYSLNVLDIPEWQKDGLRGLGLKTLGDVLGATEETFKRIFMVGEKRSRRIQSAAVEAVFEYLSG
ncbi:MAG: hypothetical protein KIT84_01115 [Labilithrix sp.]|nr:hypothetical protein [Labilithrix sp.]MCW5809585.1 hypothetical protein [Labilithrix sp.]